MKLKTLFFIENKKGPSRIVIRIDSEFNNNYIH